MLAKLAFVAGSGPLERKGGQAAPTDPAKAMSRCRPLFTTSKEVLTAPGHLDVDSVDKDKDQGRPCAHASVPADRLQRSK